MTQTIDFNVALEDEGATAMVVKDPFDMEAIHVTFEGYLAEIMGLQATAEALLVQNDSQATEAVTLLGKLKKVANRIEKERKYIVEVPNAFVKKVNNFTKSISSPLQAAEKALKGKIATFQYQLELERRKREEQVRKAQAGLQERLNAEAAKSNTAPVQIIDIPIKEEKPIIRTEQGSASIRKAWKGEITDASQVPFQFCSPDQRKIDEAVKGGLREIPGVRIYEHITTVIR